MLLRNVVELGWAEPTEIQRLAIPAILAGHDIYGVAQTGTGKTGAFVLPILQRLLSEPPAQSFNPYCVVLSPTRELVMQIAGQFSALAAGTSIRVGTAFGGTAENPQIEALSAGCEVLVGAPGRVLDLMGRGWLQYRELRFAVLDEADRMFDMGFIADIRTILNRMPSRRQTLLFTATLPEGIKKLAREYLFYPQEIRVGRTAPPAKLTHEVVHVAEGGKERALEKLLREDFDSVMVFCRTKRGAEQLGRQLIRAGESCAILHADRTQQERTKAFERFSSGEARVLVATDVASRGLDIDDISLVVNFDVPLDPDDYVHRVGRTARAKKHGLALTLVTPKEERYVRRIEQVLKQPIEVRGSSSNGMAPARESAAARPPAARSGEADAPGSRRRRGRRGGRGRSKANAAAAESVPAPQDGKPQHSDGDQDSYTD